MSSAESGCSLFGLLIPGSHILYPVLNGQRLQDPGLFELGGLLCNDRLFIRTGKVGWTDRQIDMEKRRQTDMETDIDRYGEGKTDRYGERHFSDIAQ